MRGTRAKVCSSGQGAKKRREEDLEAGRRGWPSFVDKTGHIMHRPWPRIAGAADVPGLGGCSLAHMMVGGEGCRLGGGLNFATAPGRFFSPPERAVAARARSM